MSVENVKAFYERVAEDEALQEKLKALAEREEEDKELREELQALAERVAECEEAMYADLVQIASAAGFEFTTADARKARLAAVRKLSDEELEAVAGGQGMEPACYNATYHCWKNSVVACPYPPWDHGDS